MKKLNGRGALLRVRDRERNRDAEHRVPTGSGLCAQPNFFTAPLALSPNPTNGLGERVERVGTVTQGGARGSCLALALGYDPPPRRGSMTKKRPPAASQMSNLHIPAFAGMTEVALIAKQPLVSNQVVL